MAKKINAPVKWHRDNEGKVDILRLGEISLHLSTEMPYRYSVLVNSRVCVNNATDSYEGSRKDGLEYIQTMCFIASRGIALLGEFTGGCKDGKD